jgi:hypothetical protein
VNDSPVFGLRFFAAGIIFVENDPKPTNLTTFFSPKVNWEIFDKTVAIISSLSFFLGTTSEIAGSLKTNSVNSFLPTIYLGERIRSRITPSTNLITCSAFAV